jgi:ABC-type cobalt transport system, periplasmic component
MKLWKKNGLLLALVLLLVAIPLLTIKDSEFGGTDDGAGNVINAIAPEFKPWTSPIYELPGTEMQTLFFSFSSGNWRGHCRVYIGQNNLKEKR